MTSTEINSVIRLYPQRDPAADILTGTVCTLESITMKKLVIVFGFLAMLYAPALACDGAIQTAEVKAFKAALKIVRVALKVIRAAPVVRLSHSSVSVRVYLFSL
jgi:hypothetical protein